MSAFDIAKTMSADEIKAKVSGLREFGCDRTAVADKWAAVDAEREFQPYPIAAVGALNNADTDKALLCLLKENTEKVFAGLCIAAKAVNADRKVIYLPEGEEKYAEELAGKAAEYGIEVLTGIVNVRKTRGGAYHHFATLIAIADIFEGTYKPSVYLAVRKDGETGEVKAVEYGTKLADIVGTDDVKAIAIGNILYDKTALEMVIDDSFNPENGVITVYPKDCCMVNEVKVFTDAYKKQSCGKCTFCREGLNQISEFVNQVTQGKGGNDNIPMIKEIGGAMVFSTQCTLGERAAVFALNAVDIFANEFNDHIKKKKCPNNVCKAFSTLYIDPMLCTGCEECVESCPKDAIDGKAGYIHMIDDFECDKCGKCIGACEEEAIVLTTGRVPKLPTRLIRVGKFKKR